MSLRKSTRTIALSFLAFAIGVFALSASLAVQKQVNVNSSFAVGLSGDVNSDGKVDIVDIGIIIDNYGRSPIPNANADINRDGRVDIVDIGICIDNYGRTGSTSTPTPNPSGGGNAAYDQVVGWVNAYAASHPGASGDVTDMPPAVLAADAAATQLESICGPDQRVVYPKLAWEFGGNDHAWINPGASALAYCVYIPVSQPTSHWNYNANTGRVTADMYVKFPDQNPCKNMTGKDQVIACLGDPTNSEILVDRASFHDGVYAPGVPDLSEASTELMLILPNGQKVQLLINI